MTPVRARRGRRVHAWTQHGERRDLDPDHIPNLVCGRRLKAPLIVDEPIDCEACIDILFNGN